MNRKLIKTLKEERRKLYPHGLPIRSRGCCKTYVRIWHFLRYIAFDVVINEYKKTDREVSLEDAHDDMNYFISEMMNEIRVW